MQPPSEIVLLPRFFNSIQNVALVVPETSLKTTGAADGAAGKFSRRAGRRAGRFQRSFGHDQRNVLD
jgi:hypothetical protein